MSFSKEESQTPYHRPVFAKVIEKELLTPGDKVILDATLGEGGHTKRFLLRGMRVIACERDPLILRRAKAFLRPYYGQVCFYHTNFSEVDKVLQDMQGVSIDLALFDLGVSMYHYKTSESLEGARPSGRGFSFMDEASLDMRLSPETNKTAAQIINTASERELADTFYRYGGERHSRRIASHVVRRRSVEPFRSAADVSRAVNQALKGVASFKKTSFRRRHAATKVFQALRIVVNNELEPIREGLCGALRHLAVGGRLVVISYHSLEDALVKQTFKSYLAPLQNINKYQQNCINNDTKKTERYSLYHKKPLRPSSDEIQQNPSARSAKMRVMIKTSA